MPARNVPPPSNAGGGPGEPLIIRAMQAKAIGEEPPYRVEVDMEARFPHSPTLSLLKDNPDRCPVRQFSLVVDASGKNFLANHVVRVETDDADFTGVVRVTGATWRIQWFADFHDGRSVASP